MKKYTLQQETLKKLSSLLVLLSEAAGIVCKYLPKMLYKSTPILFLKLNINL